MIREGIVMYGARFERIEVNNAPAQVVAVAVRGRGCGWGRCASAASGRSDADRGECSQAMAVLVGALTSEPRRTDHGIRRARAQVIARWSRKAVSKISECDPSWQAAARAAEDDPARTLEVC